jgi:hypothetical protein
MPVDAICIILYILYKLLGVCVVKNKTQLLGLVLVLCLPFYVAAAGDSVSIASEYKSIKGVSQLLKITPDLNSGRDVSEYYAQGYIVEFTTVNNLDCVMSTLNISGKGGVGLSCNWGKYNIQNPSQ